MRTRVLSAIISLCTAGAIVDAAAAPDIDSLLLRGEALRKKAKYCRAQKSIESAIQILQAKKEPHPAQLSAAYNYLALIENNTGKYADSENHARKAIEFAKQAELGPDNLAMHSVVLANAMRQQGKYVEAGKILQEALKVLDKPSMDQALLATAQNNLGAIYYWLGNYDKAKPLLLKGLDTRVKALGAEHADVANSYLDLGATEFKIGNIDKAIENVSDSVRIRKKALGEKHPETLAAEATLAVFLESRGATAEASDLLGKVVAQARQSLGRRHPDLAQYEDDYANVLASQKQLDKARAMQADAASIRKAVFGAASRDYAASLRSLAQIEVAAGGQSKAGELLEQSAALYKAAGQPADPDYADTLDDLGTQYVTAGKLDAARKAFDDAASIRAQAGATIASAISLANLADVLLRLNRQAESTEALRKAKSVIDALPAPLQANPDCASIIQRLQKQSRFN